MIISSKHPMQQWVRKVEKAGDQADYFKREMVDLSIFDGALEIIEPSNTMNNYMSFTKQKFVMTAFHEDYEHPDSRRIIGKNYPPYFMFEAKKKDQKN
ncbi:MAG: hypothetical protein ACI83D_000138 [Planctomycetota bacterium]|jgi:hypothetical protein